MSDLLLVANGLRRGTDQQLRNIIRQRQVSLQSKDFLELAEQLLTSKSIESALAKLTATELEALSMLLQTASGAAAAENSALYNLAHVHALAVETENIKLIQVPETIASIARVKLGGLPADFATQPTVKVNEPASNLPSNPNPSNENLDALGAIAAFELQLGLTELVLDLDQRQVRVIGKNKVGLGDYKRLATQLRKSVDDAKILYAFAEQLQLIEIQNGRWQLTPIAANWLQIDIPERWQACVENWIDALGPNAVNEFAARILAQPQQSVSQSLSQTFILADKNVQAQLSQLVVLAQWCGLAVADQPTRLMTQVLTGDHKSAKENLQAHLPAEVAQLIIQADQTLIAPGPLPTNIEVTLRRFVELEQVSVATSYRITALSVTHGLETGLTEDDIRQLLASLSNKPLPQPIDYLIRETASRFGRLTVASGQSPDRAIIQSKDGILLTEILNDVRLRPYGLRPIAAQSLSSRFEPDVLYFGLRENGFLAVRVDASGQVISPRKSLENKPSDSARIDKYQTFIDSLRQTESRIGSQPSDDDLLRQIQLAIKNKTELTLHLTMRDGSAATYRIHPKSLANGRVRGLDAKADAERVLPLAQVTRIEF